MKKLIKISSIIFAVVIVGLGILIFSFVQEMKPDKDEEEKIITQSKQYLEEKFNDNFEIYDTLYDNMGNFEFEYAAKVRDKKMNTQFLVYYDDETKQMVDTYISDKWEDDLETEIRPYIRERFGESTNFFVFFINDNIGQELGIDPLNPRSYKEFAVSPTICITVPRKRGEEDEKILDEFLSFLKSEDILEHGIAILEYIDEKGVILDEEWGKEF